MFNSLEAICEEFGIQKNLSKSKLRAELKKRIASIHSDKTGGAFPSEAVKQLYLRMQRAVEYLDNPTRITALAKRSPVGDALEARVAVLESSNRLKDSSFEDSARSTSENAGRLYRGGLISSGVFAAICGGILSFSKKLSEIPLFTPILGAYWVHFLIIAAFVISGFGFVLMRIKELKLKRQVSAVLSEDGIAWTVRQCIYKYNEEPDCAITLRKMMDAVDKCGTKWHKSEIVRWLRKQFGTRMPRALAEKIAKLQIASLVERGVIRRGGTLGIEPVYMLDSSQAKEIIDDHGAIFFEPE